MVLPTAAVEMSLGAGLASFILPVIGVGDDIALNFFMGVKKTKASSYVFLVTLHKIAS